MRQRAVSMFRGASVLLAVFDRCLKSFSNLNRAAREQLDDHRLMTLKFEDNRPLQVRRARFPRILAIHYAVAVHRIHQHRVRIKTF